MKVYLVTVEDFEGMQSVCVCKDARDLVSLINNIDKQVYEILTIKTVNWVESFMEFCKKENFEHGGVGPATVA